MSIEKWVKRSERLAYTGYRNILKRTFELPNGMHADFDIVTGPRVVCVLALTPDNDVLLVKQFRPGPEEVFLDLPGGAVDDNETPTAAAERELLEETGYAGKLNFLGEGFGDGYSTLRRFHYVATGCVEKAAPKPDPQEFLEVVRLDLPAFRKHLRGGLVTDVGTAFLGLEFLKLL